MKYGVPISPGITGEIEALKSLKLALKLVVATPHEESLNQRNEAFLEGFRLPGLENRRIRSTKGR